MRSLTPWCHPPLDSITKIDTLRISGYYRHITTFWEAKYLYLINIFLHTTIVCVKFIWAISRKQMLRKIIVIDHKI